MGWIHRCIIVVSGDVRQCTGIYCCNWRLVIHVWLLWSSDSLVGWGIIVNQKIISGPQVQKQKCDVKTFWQVMSAKDRGESQLTRVLLNKFNHCLKDVALKLSLKRCKQISKHCTDVWWAKMLWGQRLCGHIDVSQSPFECLVNYAKNEFAVQLVGGQFSFPPFCIPAGVSFYSCSCFPSPNPGFFFFLKTTSASKFRSKLKTVWGRYSISMYLQLLVSLMCLSHQSSDI